MPTTIGKKLRSRKVQLACERRQNQYADNTNEQDYGQKQILLSVNDPNYSNLQQSTLEEQKHGSYHLIPVSDNSTHIELKNMSKKGNGKGNFFLFI